MLCNKSIIAKKNHFRYEKTGKFTVDDCEKKIIFSSDAKR